MQGLMEITGTGTGTGTDNDEWKYWNSQGTPGYTAKAFPEPGSDEWPTHLTTPKPQ